jgi:hypothetical protein
LEAHRLRALRGAAVAACKRLRDSQIAGVRQKTLSTDDSRMRSSFSGHSEGLNH